MKYSRFVIGSGSHASEVSELIRLSSNAKVVQLDLIKEEIMLSSNIHSNYLFYLGVGDPRIRKLILERWNLHLSKFPPLIHNNSFISEKAIIENGSVIQFGCVVSTAAVLHSGVLLNWNSTIGHHSKIGIGSTINPGASIAGYCEIGQGVLVGTGARVLSGIKIGDNSVIGAGAVVTKDIPSGKTYVGIPAKELVR